MVCIQVEQEVKQITEQLLNEDKQDDDTGR